MNYTVFLQRRQLMGFLQFYDSFLEQCIPQGIVENNRKISWKLGQLNSWVGSGDLPKPLSF